MPLNERVLRVEICLSWMTGYNRLILGTFLCYVMWVCFIIFLCFGGQCVII